MVYKLRDDVVLERVSGIYILVALRSAWEESPFALQIAPVSAYIWKCMKNGLDDEEIVSRVMDAKGYTEKKARITLSHFIRAAREYHYFMPEDKG